MKAVVIMGIVAMFVRMMIHLPSNADYPLLEDCIEGYVITMDTQVPIVEL